MNRFAGLLAASCAFATSQLAHAGGGDDIVFLSNGGRLRGTIIEDHPTQGATIKLADGSVRKLKAAEIRGIRFFDAVAKKEPVPDAPEKEAAPSTKEQAHSSLHHAKLLLDLTEAKRKRSGAAVGMGVGFGMGAAFLIGGGAWYAVADRDQRVVPIIFLVGGGVEILIGIISAAIYSSYDSTVDKLESSLDARSALHGVVPRQQAMFAHLHDTASLPLPPTKWVGTWSFSF
jgi:hypothetical protein